MLRLAAATAPDGKIRRFSRPCSAPRAATATWAVALLTYLQGNVFAPAFAFLDSAFVAASLRWVWLRGERYELIALGEAEIVVRQSSRLEPLLVAHPYWVRLRVSREGGTARTSSWVRAGARFRSGPSSPSTERLDLVDAVEIIPGSGRAAVARHRSHSR